MAVGPGCCVGTPALLPAVKGRTPAARGSSELPWAPPSLFCWDEEMWESISRGVFWVLSFPGSLLSGFLLPPNPRSGGGGGVVSVLRSS